MKKRYCFVGDVLGFSSLISNLSNQEQAQRIKEFDDMVSNSARESNVKYDLMSDTIFAFSEESKEGLSSLVQFSKLLLEKGIKKSLPIRGAISFGELFWRTEAPTIHGKAILDAYNLERLQDWIGVTCCENVKEKEIEGVIVYNPPLKKGESRIMSVVQWDIPEPEELITAVCKDGLTKKGQHLRWEHFGTKINNTILFKIYNHIVNINNLHCDKFYGFLPSQLVWEYLSKSK